jgi:hypothetical protein
MLLSSQASYVYLMLDVVILVANGLGTQNRESLCLHEIYMLGSY